MNIKKLSRKKYSQNANKRFIITIKKKERIGLATGKIMVVLVNIRTEERNVIVLDENPKDYFIIYISLKVVHSVKNIGEVDTIIAMFSKKVEIPGDIISYKMEV